MFGIPKLYAYGAAVVVALLLAGSLYLKGRHDGKAVVQAVLDEQRAVWQQQYDDQVAKTAAKEAEWANRTKEIEDGLQTRLDAATASGDSLAKRLRDYRSRVCPLSTTPGSAGEADGTPGESADGAGVEAALGQHLTACARDAERLSALQQWVRGTR